MKIFALTLPVLLALTGCATTDMRPVTSDGGTAVTASPLESAPQPALISGLQWTYRRLDLWRNEEKERFSQKLTDGMEHNWAVLWTIVSSKDEARLGTTEERFDAATHGFGDARLTGAYEPLKFPLNVGKTWTFSYEFQSKASTVVEVKQTATVKGWETVTVPAGTFRALRVEHAGWYSAREGSAMWTGRITETFWYAPAARRIVAQEYRDTTGSGEAYDQRRDELVAMQL